MSNAHPTDDPTPTLFFEDVAVGSRYRSGGRTVTEADLVNFAGISGDFHPLHMDAEYAQAGVHGQRIAHGMLVLAMASGLAVRLPLLVGIERSTIGFSGFDCKFLRPTFIGDTIGLQVEVMGKTVSRRGDRGTLDVQRRIFNQREEVIIEGVWRYVVRLREPNSDAAAAAATPGDAA